MIPHSRFHAPTPFALDLENSWPRHHGICAQNRNELIRGWIAALAVLLWAHLAAHITVMCPVRALEPCGWLLLTSPTAPPNIPRNGVMFRKRRPTDSAVSGRNSNPSRCGLIQHLSCSQPVDNSLAKRQRVVDGVKILLDIAGESSDCFPPLKSALGGVNALIKHYEVSVERVILGTIYMNIRSNPKMSGRRSRTLSPCWRDSNKTSL